MATCALVAEDNEVNRLVVSRLLKQQNCRVIEAVNGVEAVEKLTPQVDVVIMDVHMPLMDGVEATYDAPCLTWRVYSPATYAESSCFRSAATYQSSS
jgi:DNA-binding NarL/FixJ family response regulator